MTTELEKEKIIHYTNKFLDELELSFEIKLDQLTNDTVDDFIKDTIENVEPLQDLLEKFSSAKTKDLVIMKDLKMFNGKLDFKIFETESKNTKKVLLGHISTIYLLCNPTASLAISPVPPPVSDAMITPQASGSTDTNSSSSVPSHAIMDIAMEVSKQMQKDKINPMELLSSLMSGNTSNISGMMANIEKTIDDKLKEKNINKEDLEKEGLKFMEMFGGKLPRGGT